MSHFAKIVNGVVTEVTVAEQDFVDTLDGEWLQTSYNTFGGVHYDPKTGKPSVDQSKALRKNYAVVGGAYDRVNDAFIHPKPYPSWAFNTTTFLWEPPFPEPNDGKLYTWDEDTTNWVEMPVSE